jgi:hypothetical protein
VSSRKHRGQAGTNPVISFSMSYNHDALLARGLGFEHLCDLVLRIARPVIRAGAILAFGGDWKQSEHNLTFALLRLISSEQEDNPQTGPDSSHAIGRMINHSAWPHELEITTNIEAQWINCCRLVRTTQDRAGIAAADIVHGAGDPTSDRYRLNRALCASEMRRVATVGTTLVFPDAPAEPIPPIAARIAIGGKLTGYNGFVPGLFEETLLALDANVPTYLLGGFGGTAAILANTVLTGVRPPELSVERLAAETPAVGRLGELVPPGVAGPVELLDRLWAKLQAGCAALQTGLGEEGTRELLCTRDVDRAVALVRSGLQARLGLAALPL